MMTAIQFWLLPAIAIGALPWLLELDRAQQLPNPRMRPSRYYLGAAILGPLVAALAMAAMHDLLFLIGAVIVLAIAWLGAFSRPGSFDPFLGAWCVVNGICALYACTYRGDLAGLGYLMVWAYIGLPLAMVALATAVILRQRPAAAAPGNPDSGSGYQATGQ